LTDVESPDPTDVEAYDTSQDRITIGGAQPLSKPIEIRDYDAEWPVLYEREEARIRSVLGERVVRIEHVGSTSVPNLCAKPIIDVVLEVADSAAEETYVPDLEAGGYFLHIREPDWFEHRLLKRPDGNVHLHVFSAGCEEVDAMLRFRDHLRVNAADRTRRRGGRKRTHESLLGARRTEARSRSPRSRSESRPLI
jgi:GrpB-like predicted nucleotidyltransferase (UPF0157 family)